MKIPVVVVGLAPQGLFLLRELSRAGFDVHVITAEKSPGYYSRYGSKYLISSHGELAERLLDLSRRFRSRVRCYISSGVMLDCILENIPEVYELFEVFPRPMNAVVRLNDKMDTYTLAGECGVRVLETFRARQGAQIREYLSSGGSLIAKWNREAGDFGIRAFKTQLVKSAEEYDSVVSSISDDDMGHLILQRVVGSDQDHNIAYFGYYVDGKCIAGYLAQQVRQFPQGITSYVREYTGRGHRMLVGQAQALFEKVNYTGFGEAEFKFDRGFDTPYLLEVNPRTCGWSSALRGRYSNLDRLFLEPSLSAELEVTGHSGAWCSLLRDVAAIAKQVKEAGSVESVFKSVASHAQVRTLDVIDFKDMKPVLLQLLRAIKK